MEEQINFEIHKALQDLYLMNLSLIKGEQKKHSLLLSCSSKVVLSRMLCCHKIYQGLVHKLIKSARTLTELQCSYWQELFFIWKSFVAELKLNSIEHYDYLIDIQDAPDFMKAFYLCHARYFQELLDLSTEIDAVSCQQVNFYIKKINSILRKITA